MGKKLYPDKQHIIELVDGLYLMGLRQVVVCPGSRSAPLTLAFARHGGFQIFTVVDERSAAYIAMGQALSARGTTPVALICTSGTAVLLSLIHI
jgi:2-succinyl-5-enolpyruvyl-6-hydroxy-3-cyclohexene-1-carboxylate synthase